MTNGKETQRFKLHLELTADSFTINPRRFSGMSKHSRKTFNISSKMHVQMSWWSQRTGVVVSHTSIATREESQLFFSRTAAVYYASLLVFCALLPRLENAVFPPLSLLTCQCQLLRIWKDRMAESSRVLMWLLPGSMPFRHVTWRGCTGNNVDRLKVRQTRSWIGPSWDWLPTPAPSLSLLVSGRDRHEHH